MLSVFFQSKRSKQNNRVEICLRFFTIMENPQEMDKVSQKLTRPVNKTTEGIVPDLRKLTKPQLLELRDRQKFLLKNK